MQGWEFRGDREVPWGVRRGLGAVLDAWRADGGIARNLVLDESLPATPAAYAPIPSALAAPVHTALERRGVVRLYAHQARAFELASAGRDVVIATPTASGKSLC